MITKYPKHAECLTAGEGALCAVGWPVRTWWELAWKEVHQRCQFQMGLATWRVPQDLADWKQQLWLRSRQARSECSWGLISLSFYFSKKCQL